MDAVSKVIFIIGMIMVVLYIVIYLCNISRFDREITSASKNMYLSSGTLIIGFSLIRYLNIRFDRNKCPKLFKNLSNLYGNLYATYYMYVVRANEIGIVYTGCMLACIIAGAFAMPAYGMLVLILIALVVWNCERELEEYAEEKKVKIVSELPVVISKLTLLVGAGVTLRNAWEQTANEGEGEIYDEMRKVMIDKANGASDEVAFCKFAEHTDDKKIKRFAVAMVQNLKKGNAEQIVFLREMSMQMWDNKKKLVLKKIEDAKSLMVLPLFMIFIGVLIMIIVPMFSSVGSFLK